MDEVSKPLKIKLQCTSNGGYSSAEQLVRCVDVRAIGGRELDLQLCTSGNVAGDLSMQQPAFRYQHST